MTMTGALDSILKAERTALNFLGHLSGIASLTRRYVDAVKHTAAIILDTRKTIPGWRSLEKYAVYCGGAQNHRRGLWDMVLVKENHLACWPYSLTELVPMIRQTYPRQVIEIEVQSIDQLQQLLPSRPSRLLLDHFSLDQMRAAVALAKGCGVLLEASGNVRLDNVKDIAETGVDFISVGALTHSAPCADFSLLVQGVK
jgi:nicotinate-nucleotide pyrophosphorylase (carboxylating)